LIVKKKKLQVDHIPRKGRTNKSNNFSHALQWVTHSKNIKLSYERGEKTPPRHGINAMKPVIQLNKDGTFVAEFESASDASRKTGINNVSNICKCCKGRKGYKSAGGYKWVYKSEYDKLNKPIKKNNSPSNR